MACCEGSRGGPGSYASPGEVKVVRYRSFGNSDVRALTPGDWLLAAGLALTLLPVVEATKWLLRRRVHPA